jgi:inosine-uridine nucleoside N-ribohydrolase
LDQTDAGLADRRESYGSDGLGQCSLAADEELKPADFRAAYRRAIEAAAGELVIAATGPLSNVAAIWSESPELIRRVKHIYISGGAVWAKGNANEAAEFNFHRDPAAADTVLSSGLPITVVPLDATSLIRLDESHVARLAASGTRTGEVLAEILQYPLERDDEAGYGKTFIHDAAAVGGIVWPNLFLRTRMRLAVAVSGKQAGRCRPALGGDKSLHVNILTAVNAVDLVENILESLCQEAFIV